MSEERYEGIRHTEKHGRPTYVMVPRKLLIAWVMSYLGIIALVLGVAVWSNYQWCGVISIFNDTYKESPPPTPTGKKLAEEFKDIQTKFLCR